MEKNQRREMRKSGELSTRKLNEKNYLKVGQEAALKQTLGETPKGRDIANDFHFLTIIY